MDHSEEAQKILDLGYTKSRGYRRSSKQISFLFTIWNVPTSRLPYCMEVDERVRNILASEKKEC